MSHDIIVVGGGAAGMMAAAVAAQMGASVLLLERNEKLGRKLYITGKGRCNLTNHCSADQVLAAVPQNSRFLYSAMTATPPAWVEEFFTGLGVALKVERGQRVFPQSDRAADVIDALFFLLRRQNVTILKERVQGLLFKGNQITGVQGERARYPAKAVLLATGGLSYPQTGSTGDGYELARQAGHTVLPGRPSLVPLAAEGELCKQMQGLALKNVQLKVKNQKKQLVFQEQGELLFTHFGLSGPLVLSASAHMRNFEQDSYTCLIDLKPALDEKTLDDRLVREFTQQSNRNLASAMQTLLPRLMIPAVAQCAQLPLERKCRDVTKAERRRLLETLKAFSISIAGPRPVEEAIVTSGGVKVSEIDPRSMASKRVAGLYFAGELLDVDAYTGGFNLQIAWATGRCAGLSAWQYCAGNGGRE